MANSSAPLADYFWIAGLESISYQDLPSPQSATQVDTTITEDGEPEEPFAPSSASGPVPSRASGSSARTSRQSSNNRISNASFAQSISTTLDELDGNTRSNRSSATIRPNPSPAPGPGPDGLFLGDFDFDKALVKFAAERENFLEDLSFSAGAKTESRPPMVRPRTQQLKADEPPNSSGRMSPMKSFRGSIRGSMRRKISFKDMNSMKKQPTAPKPGKCAPPPAPLNEATSRDIDFGLAMLTFTPSFHPNHQKAKQLQCCNPTPGTPQP